MDIELIKEYIKSGKSICGIAKILNISNSTLTAFLYRNNISRTKKVVKEKL